MSPKRFYWICGRCDKGATINIYWDQHKFIVECINNCGNGAEEIIFHDSKDLGVPQLAEKTESKNIEKVHFLKTVDL